MADADPATPLVGALDRKSIEELEGRADHDGEGLVDLEVVDVAEGHASLVEQGREFKQAVAEVLAINAQLLALFKQQEKKKR